MGEVLFGLLEFLDVVKSGHVFFVVEQINHKDVLFILMNEV